MTVHNVCKLYMRDFALILDFIKHYCL